MTQAPESRPQSAGARYCDGTSDSVSTLLPAWLDRDAVEHVAERARALQVVVIQPGQLELCLIYLDVRTRGGLPGWAWPAVEDELEQG